MLRSTTTSGILIAALFALITWLPANTTFAYELSETCGDPPAKRCDGGQESKPLRWESCPAIHVDAQGTRLIPIQKVQTEVELAIHTWADVECSSIQPWFGGLLEDARLGYRQGLTNHNVIVFQDERWPAQFDSSILAITSVTYSRQSGRIFDADIQVNTADFAFSVASETEPVETDLRNTLTHELGHLIGLDHSQHPDATMYATTPDFEISKRSLHEDDIAGLCASYPADQPLECDAPVTHDPPPQPNPNSPSDQPDNNPSEDDHADDGSSGDIPPLEPPSLPRHELPRAQDDSEPVAADGCSTMGVRGAPPLIARAELPLLLLALALLVSVARRKRSQ